MPVITDERVLLDGQTLTLTFRSAGSYFACELRAPDGAMVRAAPLLTLGASHSGSINLHGLHPGLYTLGLKSPDGTEVFGRQLASERARLADALKGADLGGNPSKVATSAFLGVEGERHVAVYADLPARELRIRVANADDIDAFLAPWSPGAATLKPARFSFVAAVHNVAKYLNEFIVSFVEQSLDFRTHAELIFVDDGSTDASASIIKRWQRRYPDAIRYFYQENSGVAEARNLGLSAACYDWVSFPDPDDFVDRDYLAEVAAAVERHAGDDIALIACYMVRYYEAASQMADNMPLRFRFAEGEKVLPANDLGRYIQGYVNGAFFRRRDIEAGGVRFDPRVRPTFEDGHFVGKFTLAAGTANVLFLPEAKYYYRKRGDRTSIMDGARHDAAWYGDALRHGHLDLLKSDREARGAVSLQAQNSVLHALSFRLQEMADRPGEAAFLTPEQRERYRELLAEIFSLIDAETIMAYDIAEMPFWHRVGLINLFKGTNPPWQQVELSDFDPGNGIARIVHWTGAPVPTARHMIDDVPLPAIDEQSHKRMLAGSAFVWEHSQRISLPEDGTLTVTVDDVAARIALPEDVMSEGATLAQVRRAFAGRIAGGDAAAHIDAQLWRGFSRSASADLGRIFTDRDAFLGDRLAAAFGKARYRASLGQHEEALDWIVRMNGLTGGRVTSVQGILLEAECLMRLGHPGEARLVLERELVPLTESDADLCLAYQSCFAGDPEADDLRLDWINRTFEAAGIHPISRRDPSRPLSIDNLAAFAPKFVPPRGHKVSVIMPAYNAEDTVATAIDSVLRQTWHDLELIVVDDCSTDGTWDIIRALAAKAPITALRQDRNAGAYAARNRGLEAATGDFITTHDADDWSHPQRIETQMRQMMERPGLQGTRSFWCRVTRSLDTTVADRPGDRPIVVNYSSFLFTRRIRGQLGRWDDVRASADHEFLRRAMRVVDAAGFVNVAPQVPLAFGLRRAASLTLSAATHVHSYLHGARRDYGDAAERWYDRTQRAEALHMSPGQPRPFPAPWRLLSDPPARTPYDVVFVFDYADPEPGSAFTAMLSAIRASVRARKRVGVFLWRDYDLSRRRDPYLERQNPRITALFDDGSVDLISAGDQIEAGTVIVGQPALLRHMIDDPPRIACDHLVLLAAQTASRYAAGREPIYVPRAIAEAAETVFGRRPVWVPVSEAMRRIMSEDGRYAPIHPATWLPLIEVEAFTSSPIAWRGGRGVRPVIGRMSRDGSARWPAAQETLRAAYCAGRAADVRILGGARTAMEILGTLPENWTVFEAGACEPADFLGPLDFLAHYPHDALLEPFPVAVAKAMAAGKPVIMPPWFSDIFGPAAVYARPESVWSRVRALWGDKAAYMAQARAGRDFAVRNLSSDRFLDQLATLDGEAPAGAMGASA